MLKALADRLAEAFAEKMHQLVRTQYWAYAKDENLIKKRLLCKPTVQRVKISWK